jgi:hypothetical protein
MAKKAFVYDGTNWIDIAQSTTDLSNYANMTTTPISGFRNEIINGDFRINQRVFTSTTTTGTYGLDRWYLETNTGTSTYSTQSFALGNVISGYEPTNFARVVTSGQSANGSFSLLTQQIEDVRNLAGQTATVSFWAKAASGTPKVAVTLDQLFGSGGSPSSAVSNLFGTVTLSTSWTRYILTATVASISGKTIGTTANTSALRLRLWVSGGSDLNPSAQSIGAQNNTFDFWGVQVEPGTIATPFEQRPIGTELALCQRYCYQINAQQNQTYFATGAILNAATNLCDIPIPMPVTMRTTPVLTSQGTFSDNSLGVNFSAVNGIVSGSPYTANVRFQYATTYTGGRAVLLASTASTDFLRFSAEL